MHNNIKRAFRILNYVGENRLTISEQKKIRCFKIIYRLVQCDSRYTATFNEDKFRGETSISIEFKPATLKFWLQH